MPFRTDLSDCRLRFCSDTATWLEINRGIPFSEAYQRVLVHYRLMADWLGQGWTAERAGTELLRIEANKDKRDEQPE